MIAPAPVPEFEARAEIYLLHSGQALYRRREEGHVVEKFVTAMDLQAAFSQQEQDSGWLPAGMARCGSNAGGPWFVYSAPAQRLDLALEEGEPPVCNIPAPRTVLIAAGGNCYLWALKTKYFEKDAEIWRAPFPNVFQETGKICWGSQPVPEATVQNARAVWKAFFSSLFNGHLADWKSAACPVDVRQQLRALAGKRKYLLDDLVPHGGRRTVEEMVISIVEGRYVG